MRIHKIICREVWWQCNIALSRALVFTLIPLQSRCQQGILGPESMQFCPSHPSVQAIPLEGNDIIFGTCLTAMQTEWCPWSRQYCKANWRAGWREFKANWREFKANWRANWTFLYGEYVSCDHCSLSPQNIRTMAMLLQVRNLVIWSICQTRNYFVSA